MNEKELLQKVLPELAARIVIASGELLTNVTRSVHTVLKTIHASNATVVIEGKRYMVVCLDDLEKELEENHG